MSATFQFKDRVSNNSDRRKLTFIGEHTGLPDSVVVKVERADTNVTEQGTPLNAATMNSLKESIITTVNAAANAAAQQATAAAQTAQEANAAAQDAANAAEQAADRADKVGIFTTGEVTDLSDFFSKVSAWARTHDQQARVILTGNFTRYEVENLQFTSNAKYTFQCSSVKGGVSVTANRLTIADSWMGAVDTPPFVFGNCADLRIEDCGISGGLAALSFQNCKNVVVKDTAISCGATAAMYILDSTENTTTLTFSHCRFNGTGDYLIDGSGIANAGVTVRLIDCTDKNGNPVRDSQIKKGSATWMIGENAETLGNFYIDAGVATNEQIAAKIAEASAWGTAHNVRANLKIFGSLSHNNFDGLVFKSNVNYTFRYDCYGRGLEANNITNCSFTECYIKCVGEDSALRLNACTDVTVRDCILTNGMSSNVVNGGNRIRFENCVISGGTYLKKTVTLQGQFAAGSTITYANCIFNNSYDTLIDATDCNGGVVILDNCADGNGNLMSRSKISAGSGAIRFYLSGEVPAGQSGELSSVGEFYIDADSSTAEEINAKIAEASSWGETHSARANLKIGGTIATAAKVEAIAIKSHINYTLRIRTGGRGLIAENLTDIGFSGCDIECVSDNGPITLKNCTDVVVRDCKLVNVMSSNTVENCDSVYFDHCKISGGTAYRNTVTVKDTGTVYRRVTFRDCTLDNDYDVIVSASGVTNTASVVAFYDCVKGDGNYLPAGKIAKGSGKICLTSATEI